ncbi:MAG: GHKL domain-containing protein [Colwelliaceae bacterium]|nr:GHKL domain-containing protein [Colwelliaceae bacterium]
MKRNKPQSFEGNIVKLVTFACTVPSLLLFYFLIDANISFYLKLIITILVITVVSYFCFRVHLKIHHQFRTSTNLLEAIIVGDSSMRASSHINLGVLAEFNQVLNGITKALTKQNQAIKEQQLLFAKVIDQIDVAIIATDANNKIALINPSAEKLFSCRQDEIIHGPISQLGLQHVIDQEVRKVVEFELKQFRKKVYLHTDEYLAFGQQHKLIFITDIQRLLRDEERQAWQRLVRVLSHEINNSLAPIASISETLKHICEQELSTSDIQDDLQEGLSVISERAQSLNYFIDSYHQLSTLPAPSKSVIGVADFISSVTALYANVVWDIQGESTAKAFIDVEQMQQTLVNLITNAIEATEDNHDYISLAITWKTTQDKLIIKLEDNGGGIANIDNLFVPFYSTKKQGSGIGLVLSRQIVMNHDGDLQLKNREDNQGVIASIYLPFNKSAGE